MEPSLRAQNTFLRFFKRATPDTNTRTGLFFSDEFGKTLLDWCRIKCCFFFFDFWSFYTSCFYYFWLWAFGGHAYRTTHHNAVTIFWDGNRGLVLLGWRVVWTARRLGRRDALTALYA